MSIIITEGDVDISEQPFIYFPGIVVSGPTCLSSKMWSTKDCPDFTWGLHLWSVILWSRPPVIDVVLQVLAADKFLYLIFQGDTFLYCIVDISVKSVILVMIPLGTISPQWVKTFENF